MNFVGIQFAVDAPTINASSVTHFHLDVQAREDVEAGDFLIKEGARTVKEGQNVQISNTKSDE